MTPAITSHHGDPRRIKPGYPLSLSTRRISSGSLVMTAYRPGLPAWSLSDADKLGPFHV